jgi:hypothetical protein
MPLRQSSRGLTRLRMVQVEALRMDLEAAARAAESQASMQRALQADLKARDEEVLRLQAYVHKAGVQEMQAEALKLKVR